VNYRRGLWKAGALCGAATTRGARSLQVLIYRKNKNKFWPGQEQVASILSRVLQKWNILREGPHAEQENPASFGEKWKEMATGKGLCAVNY